VKSERSKKNFDNKVSSARPIQSVLAATIKRFTAKVVYCFPLLMPTFAPIMCTVTYLPRPSGFILTHNRDEASARSSQTIVHEKTPGGQTLLFPRDTLAGGTWIATSRQGRTACLLNGAFVLHKRALPYRRSRGLILLDFFDWKDSDDFFQHYNFENIEPFTFLFFNSSQLPESLKLLGGSQVTEFRWDGQQRHLKNLAADQPHFWCSATLYPSEMQIRREQVFRQWLTKHPPITPSFAASFVKTTADKKDAASNQSPSTHHQAPVSSPRSLISLHLKGSIGDPENDFVMNRAGKVQTVSITQVIVHEKSARMRHLDLLGGNRSERRLIRSKRAVTVVNR